MDQDDYCPHCELYHNGGEDFCDEARELERVRAMYRRGRDLVNRRAPFRAAQEDSRRACLQNVCDVESRWYPANQVVPAPQGLPPYPFGDDGLGPGGQPTARRTVGQAKRARESSPEPEDLGTRRTKSAKFERRFNHLYRPDHSLPDANVAFGKHKGKLVSQLMDGGREIEYLRWLQSDQFTPRPNNAELLRAAKAHSQAFDRFMNTLEPDLIVERQ